MSAPQTEEQSLSPAARRRILRPHLGVRFRLIVGLLVAVMIAVISVLANLVGLIGPFWPTRPEVQFRDTVDAGSFVLPFKMTNRSTLFNIENMHIACGVDLFYFIDVNGITGVLRDAKFDLGPMSIDRGSFINYPCTASSYLQLMPDYSFLIGLPAGERMTSAPSNFRGPLRIVKMCLWISGTYKTFGYPISFSSKMFQWPATPGGHQWIEGTISPDLPNEAWIPANSRIGVAWAMRNLLTPDKSGFLPGALQCTRVSS